MGREQLVLKYFLHHFAYQQYKSALIQIIQETASMMKPPQHVPPKQFFTELGNELCNMKNSPFFRIGQSNKAQNSQNETVLSYAPDRLFNPDKHLQKMQSIEQQSYKKFLKEQQQKQEYKIQYDMLKRNTNQEYLKQVEKMNQMRRFDHKEPYSWFGVYRGTCLLCGTCTQYQGCFSYSQMHAMGPSQFVDNAYYSGFNDRVQLMQCYKCKCPMNSHVALPHIPTLRNQFYRSLIHKNIQDNYLKFNHIILAFKLPQQNLPHFHNIIQLLRSLNCPVINYKSFTKLSFELALIKASIVQNGNTEKLYIQSLLNLLESIKMEKQWKWSDSKFDINQIYEEFYDIVRKVGVKVQADMGIAERECVLVVLCRYEIADTRNLIRYLSGKSRVGHVVQRSSTNSTNASSISSNRNSNYSRSAYGSDMQQTDMSMLQQKYNIKFIYGTNQKKQSIILSQYFFKQNYEIAYKIFMLPGGSLTAGSSNSDEKKNQQEYNSARFKDILDYNSFVVFLENFRDVDRASFEEVMSKVIGFRSSKIDYIMGQQLLNQKIKKLGIKLAVKIGTPNLTIPFENIPDFITIKNTAKMQVPKILKAIYPEFTYSQRCVVIIRPFVMNSNFEEVIVNLLRINKFVLLRRIQVKLSEPQARYLATLEGIDDQMLDTYVQYMTAGVCEVVLTSKRAAIYQAYALAHGCLNGPSDISTKNLKNIETRGTSNAITVQIKKNRQVYQQELPLYSHAHESRNIHYPSSSTQIFKSIREMIDIQKVLFGYNYPPQYATNIRNGEITKIDPLLSTSSTTQGNSTHASSQVNVSHKIKESMLKELKKDNFNFWVFTSKSENLTEQLASIFLPQCTLFQPITVVVKPGLFHLVPAIRRALIQHKYHIIVEKQLQMNTATATQFVYNCQKIRIPPETMKYIIEAYTKQKVYMFCLSKVSGRKQIMSMLSGYTFLTNMAVGGIHQSKVSGNFKEPIGMFAQDQFITDQMLYDMLVPVWNNQELCLRMIAEPLVNLEQSVRIICQYNEENAENKSPLKKSERFIVLNYLVGSFYGVSIENIELDTKLGRLSILLSDQPVVPRLQSWYYAQISNIKPNYVPLLFQYRQIGQTMVCIQSDKGTQFMEMIIKMYTSQQNSIKANEENEANNFLRPPKKEKRRSLVLFLWGKKLSELCLDLCQVRTELNDFGDIVYKTSEFRGAETLEQAQLREYGFLNRLLHEFESQKDIKYNIRKLMDSRHQKQRYLAKNKRLLPSFILSGLQQCIRVIEKTETRKLNLMDKYSFVDPENESSKQKDLYSLHLFNVIPEIRTKYAMVAEIYYFFVKAEFEHAHLTEMIAEIEQIFSDMLTNVEDLDVIEFQIYLRFLIEYDRMLPEQQFRGKLFSILKSYPNLRKNKRIQRDDVAGKKRKLIDHKQYFRRNNQQNDEVKETIEKKYVDFDLNSLREEIKPSILYDPKDPLHYRFANVENKINLLREAKHDQQRNGIYVEFQKNISEKQELLKEKIRKQAERFNYQKQHQILRETGLERDLWYRRTKGEQKQTTESKTNTAIQKQIERLLNFKKEEEKKKSQNKTG